ncbi:GNAT family N-acetyltransferase [Paenibacillus aestuarii]|uniref:GNAT family N-acetyltransferase n=1 Tax=Paenibacillus aestuarii TaxID=516965 RepID=A0ABW0KJJ0_9BACL|nr:GNAT family N-acetyltransferase [Paenibacillus aestuarii]
MDTSKKANIEVRPPQSAEDQAWLGQLWLDEWGGDTMVSRGKLYRYEDVSAVIAWLDGSRVGAATYSFDKDDCELTSINAVITGSGIGSHLLSFVEQTAREAGLGRLWFVTTNDNVDALRFYQKRDYRLAAVHVNAIEAARKLKPSIPAIGYYGIPIRDELELEKLL